MEKERELGLLGQNYESFIRERNNEADQSVSYFIYGFFVFGIVLAFFYDTWVFAFGIGGLSLAVFIAAKFLAPGTFLSRAINSSIFSLFMLQFIGQMHGMYEMHFFFFTNIAILIIYQDWRLLVPYTLLAVIHHTSLFAIQMSGYEVREYFIDVDSVSYTLLIFHVALVLLMTTICGWWSIKLAKRSREGFEKQELFENYVKNMQKNIEFAAEISQGKLDATYTLDEDDSMGASLLDMRTNLHNAANKEQEERFKQEGLGQINEILRNSTENINELGDRLVANIVRYFKANQGGIYIVEEENDESHLCLLSCFAYDRKKFKNQKIAIGEGLTGQCVLEKDLLYFTDVPENYVRITSGLGEATPRCLILVPLKTSKDEVIGVLELASFTVFEDYQISLLERMAEAIASSLIAAKVNQRTQLLLRQSQEQTEELRAAEEEMRQNMEELEATQEEMERQELAVRNQLSAINNTMAMVELSKELTFNSVNDNFAQMIGVAAESIKQKALTQFLYRDAKENAEITNILERVLAGNACHAELHLVGSNNKDVYLKASLTPLQNKNGQIEKIVLLAIDYSQDKKTALNHSSKIEAIDRTNAVIEFTPNGKILTANNNFEQVMGYSLSEIEGKHHRIFVPKAEQATEAYQQHWLELSQGIAKEGIFTRVDKLGGTRYLQGLYSPVVNQYGKVERVVKIVRDATEEQEIRLRQEFQQQIVEEQLAENKVLQANMNAYLETLDAAALMSESDLYGTIIEANTRFCQVAGYTREEVIGKPQSIVRHPENPKSLFKEMWETLKAGKIYKGRYPNKAKDGSTYWVDATIKPVFNEEGQIVKYVGIRFDITEQVKHEQEIEKLLKEAQSKMTSVDVHQQEIDALKEEQSKLIDKETTVKK